MISEPSSLNTTSTSSVGKTPERRSECRSDVIGPLFFFRSLCIKIHQQLQLTAILSASMMFPLARKVLRSLELRSFQQMMARQSHQKHLPDFHDKYGDAILASGATFCFVAWVFVITQIGLKWNLSPVGRITPKEWRK
nr:cytochrome c oxidase subunit 7B2, mitochondrial [Loxodonta africana]